MSSITAWQHNGATYRLISRTEKIFEYGYAEPDDVRFNVLQRRERRGLIFGFRWVDVEKEVVPGFAVISLGCFGDTGGWLSELIAKCRRELGAPAVI